MKIDNSKLGEYCRTYDLVLNIFYQTVVDFNVDMNFAYIDKCLEIAAGMAYMQEIISESEWRTFDNRKELINTDSELNTVNELKMEEVTRNCFNLGEDSDQDLNVQKTFTMMLFGC